MKRLGCVALGLWLGCSSTATVPEHTQNARSRTVASESVTSYDTAVLDHGVRGDAADASLAESVHKACSSHGLTLDGRLGALGEVLAESSQGARAAPSYARVSHEARRTGLVEPTPEVWLASGPNTRALTASLTEQIGQASARGKLSHCGVGAVREGKGVVVALVLSGRFLALAEPVPQRVERGGTVTLRGMLAPGYRDPTLALTDPSGAVSRRALGKGRDVAHRLVLADAGVYSVELLAEGPQGITVVANIPVGVDTNLGGALVEDGGAIEDNADEVAAHLFEAIAKERAKRGLAPLKLDTRLTEIALAHDQDMQKHGFIAHTSPTTGEATDRVKRAGLTATVVLENIGRGYSAQEIHQGLMESPGHRGNVLHPDARELGIAVVAEPEGGRQAFLATELFTRLAKPVSLEDAPRALLKAVQARRKKLKAPALSLDDGLSKVAQDAARRWALGSERNENALLDQATRAVTSPPADIRGLGAALVLTDDLEQVWDSPRLLDPKLRKLGVGVARLNSSDSHALVVVLLLGIGP